MKKILYVAFMAIAAATMTACGGSNEKKSVNVDGQEVVVSEEVADLDLQGISDLVKKDSKDVTADDYDFVIDQLEILNKKTAKMNNEEFQIWRDSLSSDDKGVVMTLGLMAEGMQKRAELSDSQRERLDKVLAELDKRD
ncbi:MAG: hypothetical protein PUA94_01595 [Bacteroidales bacterium]|nr:hypothetical protein [Bacteroidales bacterium]